MAQSDLAGVPQTSVQQAVRQFPTLDHVWLFAAVALIALRPLLTPIPPHDFWWHMATGRLIVQTGAIPTVDQFSYTQAGEPFYNQGWLAQVLMYGIHSLGGVPLLLVVQAAVVALTYGLLLLLCIRRSGALRLSVGVLLMTTMPLSFDNWNVRPQTYAFPLFIAFLYILTMWRLRDSAQDATSQSLLKGHRLWLLPLLMVVWVNLHGSFVLGGALIAMTFVGEWLRRFIADRREAAAWATRPIGEAEDVLHRPPQPTRPPLMPLVVWGAVTALALLINPRGLEVLAYVRDLLSTSAVTSLVTEWAPPTIRDIGGMIFFLFVMFSVAVLTYARRRPDLVDMLFAAAFFWLALGAVRNIVWFGMVMTPLLVVLLAARNPVDADTPVTQTRFQGLPAMNWVLIGILSLLLLLGLPWVKPALDLPPELGSLLDQDTPVAATTFMRADAQRPERLFHAMSAGSYLIWAAPEQSVFIDPRIELYPMEQWHDYINLSNGENVDALLAKYQIDGLLLDNEQQEALLEHVRADPAWDVRYEDAQSTYLVRRGT
ncbi:MAG: hypothetical protein ACLFVO_13245 [Chloroflexaceae bacterium]